MPPPCNDVLEVEERVFSLSANSLMEAESWNGKYLIVLYTLDDSDNRIASHALIDCSATRLAFNDDSFINYHQLPPFKVKQPQILEVIESKKSSPDLSLSAQKLSWISIVTKNH